MFSHHSHSGQFCSHAKGTLEEVVKEAIRRGWSTLGLSEHVPRYRQQDLYPEEVRRSLPSLPVAQNAHNFLQEELGVDHLSTTFEVYLVEAWRLKELYASRIAVLVGIESEYITDSGLDQLELLLKKHGDTIQYVVGSVHHCHEHAIDFDKHRFDVALASFPSAESSNTKKEDDPDANQFSQLFCAYFDAQYTVLDRLRPAVVGHFDLCRLYYPERDFRSFPAVWAKIERNIRLGVSYGALFEVNASAFRKGWSSAYPAPDVFEVRPPPVRFLPQER